MRIKILSTVLCIFLIVGCTGLVEGEDGNITLPLSHEPYLVEDSDEQILLVYCMNLEGATEVIDAAHSNKSVSVDYVRAFRKLDEEDSVELSIFENGEWKSSETYPEGTLRLFGEDIFLIDDEFFSLPQRITAYCQESGVSDTIKEIAIIETGIMNPFYLVLTDRDEIYVVTMERHEGIVLQGIVPERYTFTLYTPKEFKNAIT